MDSSRFQETLSFSRVNINICSIPHFITENLRWVQHVRVKLATASLSYSWEALSQV